MTTIIAEAGVNHNGNIEIAKQLVEAAAHAGADYIKFQTFKADKLVTINAPKAEYQNNNTNTKESQYEMIKKLELSIEDHLEIIEHCKLNKIQFLSSAFDVESLEFLKSLGINVWKIPSGEITNFPYLKKIGSYGQKVILSTGMATLGEIEDAINVLQQNGTDLSKITVLQCNTAYPTPMEDVNLMAMLTIQNAFKVNVGFSDHTLGIEIPIAAVALGATVIEKHFTLDKTLEGPDHKASLNPNELNNMVTAIRNVEKAKGNGIKSLTNSEQKNKSIARKSIVAKTKIEKDEIFTEDNLTVKRPGTGISPMMWNFVVGKKASRNFSVDEIIKFEDICLI